MLCAIALAVAGCGGDKAKSKKKKTTVDRSSGREPDFKTYGPLPSVITHDIYLPFLLGVDGIEDRPCLQNVDVNDLKVDEHDVMARDLIKDHEGEVTQTIRNWFIQDLGPMGLTDVQANGWSVSVEDVVTIKAPVDALRFAGDQQCIDNSGRLPQDTHVVTELIGARIFKFETTLPLDYDLQQEMLRVVLMENMELQSDVFFVYEPALDGTGQPMTNFKKEPLFTAPDGSRIPEKEVPAPENRLMKEWVLKSETPIFFGFKEMPDEAWRREAKKGHCDVFLVWGDATPRPAECPEFQESTFLAHKTDSGALLTIETNGEKRNEEFAFDTGRMLQVSDRIILWIAPKEVEEGLRLRINSLVLNPKPMQETDSSTFRVPSTRKSKPKAEEPRKESKGKKKREKKSDSDNVSLDDYLRE